MTKTSESESIFLTTYRHSEDVVCRQDDRTAFNKATGNLLQMNDVGYTIFLSFRKEARYGDVVSTVSAIFGETNSNSAHLEIGDFVDELISNQMIEECH